MNQTNTSYDTKDETGVYVTIIILLIAALLCAFLLVLYCHQPPLAVSPMLPPSPHPIIKTPAESFTYVA